MKNFSTVMVITLVFTALSAVLTVPAQGVEEKAVRANPANGLTPQERDGLLLMREEEKLARDVYGYLYERHNLRIFNNIRNSESRHMAAVKNLLDRYGLPDPAADAAPGEFTNQNLQTLYNQLTARGAASLEEALRVGVAIEELDIADLEELIAQTSRPDIVTVYTNLLNGSHNHLDAFNWQLEIRGYK